MHGDLGGRRDLPGRGMSIHGHLSWTGRYYGKWDVHTWRSRWKERSSIYGDLGRGRDLGGKWDVHAWRSERGRALTIYGHLPGREMNGMWDRHPWASMWTRHRHTWPSRQGERSRREVGYTYMDIYLDVA